MIKHIYYIFILFIIVISSCDLDENTANLDESFLKIYNDRTFSSASSPLDIKQTLDGGYVFLAEQKSRESNFQSIYIMKTDSLGLFESDEIIDGYVQAVPQLLEIGSSLYFIAMEEVSFRASIFLINNDGTISEPTPLGNIQFPLSANLDGDNIIVQSYNVSDKKTVLSITNPAGSIIGQKQFDVGTGENIEELITSHLTRSGRKFPFASGGLGNNTYYFNGFYDYTFSLVFTDLQEDSDPLGISQGQQDDGGLSSIVQLQNNTFALSRFNFGENLIAPKTELSPLDISSSVDIIGNMFPELQANAPVILKKEIINDKEIVLYGSNTRSKQIILMAYDTEDGTLLGIKYLGFSNPYEIAGFDFTEDGGLAVAGTTYAAGRFQRICLFKLPKNELDNLIE